MTSKHMWKSLLDKTVYVVTHTYIKDIWELPYQGRDIVDENYWIDIGSICSGLMGDGSLLAFKALFGPVWFFSGPLFVASFFLSHFSFHMETNSKTVQMFGYLTNWWMWKYIGSALTIISSQAGFSRQVVGTSDHLPLVGETIVRMRIFNCLSR